MTYDVTQGQKGPQAENINPASPSLPRSEPSACPRQAVHPTSSAGLQATVAGSGAHVIRADVQPTMRRAEVPPQ